MNIQANLKEMNTMNIWKIAKFYQMHTGARHCSKYM